MQRRAGEAPFEACLRYSLLALPSPDDSDLVHMVAVSITSSAKPCDRCLDAVLHPGVLYPCG